MSLEAFSDPFVYYFSVSIIMFIAGISAGNYATSLVFRLPKGLVIHNDPPYCECPKRVYLQTKDLFPLFSWLSTKGTCRYCDIKIPATYAMIEALCGFLFVINAILIGFGEELILILSMDVIAITIAALYYMEGKLYGVLVVGLAGLGAIYQTLMTGSILTFVMSGYLGAMMGLALWGLEALLKRERPPLPAYVIMMGIAGICLGRDMLIPFFIVAFIIACLVAFLGCASEKFRDSAWVIGITGSIILALSHV